MKESNSEFWAEFWTFGCVKLAGEALRKTLLSSTINILFSQIGKNPMQSPGAYALLNAMKNNAESVLLEFDFRVMIKWY